MLTDIRLALREPTPLRFLILRWLDRKLKLFSYQTSLEIGSAYRPWYGYSLLQSAELARTLGYPAISAIEFGVAGGNGLVALEKHAVEVEKVTGVKVQVYGFDTGSGMPPALDARDLPYLWQSGYFAMDQEKLKARLTTAKLVLGQVEETVVDFFGRENPPPIGFISFDLDYYSSTMAAFKIFDADHSHFLPRVTCYFDDLVGSILDAYTQFSGELLAIDEFNAAHADLKIDRVRGLRHHTNQLPAQWHEQIYVAHRFSHPDYTRPITRDCALALND